MAFFVFYLLLVEAGSSGGSDNGTGNQYVTYVEGSDHSTTIYATAATTATTNGQNM